MAQYSIKELEHLSGIKAHTIRIWEQRYNILQPQRTETNIRYYDDAALKSILNISLLNDHGYKISRIARMTTAQISEEVLKVTEKNNPGPRQLNALVLAMMEMNEERFDKVLTTVILQKGLERGMLEVVLPFLTKIGLLWQVGAVSPAQEHFVSNIIRQKLYVAIDGLIVADRKTARRFMLYLPEGEMHEIGLLFCNFLLRVRGYHVLYLGPSLSLKDLRHCVDHYHPHYICTAFVCLPEKSRLEQYLHDLTQLRTQVILHLAGPADPELTLPELVNPVNSIAEFIQRIDVMPVPA